MDGRRPIWTDLSLYINGAGLLKDEAPLAENFTHVFGMGEIFLSKSCVDVPNRYCQTQNTYPNLRLIRFAIKSYLGP
jgi:hypothetical protein